VLAAVDAQRALAAHPWPEAVELRVRMGIHTGEAALAADRYVGLAVHRAARICAAGAGGQVLVSQTTANLLEDEEEELPGIAMRDLGEHTLKDLARPVRVYQIDIDGLRSDFPPLAGTGSQVAPPVATVAEMGSKELERGRACFAARAWMDAYRALSAADQASPLGADDLELLATSTSMLGRMDEYLGLLERVHHAYLDAGEPLRAARAAGWLGINLAFRGEVGPAGGWFGRAHRLVAQEGRPCVEQGWLFLPEAFQHEARGDREAAFEAAANAAEIGERFRDKDLVAVALHMQGILRIKQGRIGDGLRLLDEAMVAVTAGELSPVFTGIVYCGVILACEDAYDVRRAGEWTNALTRWCDQQPQMVSFTGRCLAHRAGIMQLRGQWRDALAEARVARERCEQAMNRPAAGQAFYQQGELHRLQGDLDAAERAYREANRRGREPQPGLALLRLAQRKGDAAAAAIRRALGETTEPLKRAKLLPALAEIALAVGDIEEARTACRELAEIAAGQESPMLRAIAAHVTGAVELADGDAGGALVSLRRAWQLWQELEAPYEGARTRVLLGLACRRLGDEDTAALEVEAAREVFEELGAAPDVAWVGSLLRPAAARDTHGLSARELEVLRLVATGTSNKEIAAALVVSEHTVARHVQNIFAKLGVSSRTAASAFAFEHDLI
jgi:ATP/maltotriose-dependent transcriptional regulator MalT